MQQCNFAPCHERCRILKERKKSLKVNKLWKEYEFRRDFFFCNRWTFFSPLIIWREFYRISTFYAVLRSENKKIWWINTKKIYSTKNEFTNLLPIYYILKIKKVYLIRKWSLIAVKWTLQFCLFNMCVHLITLLICSVCMKETQKKWDEKKAKL